MPLTLTLSIRVEDLSYTKDYFPGKRGFILYFSPIQSLLSLCGVIPNMSPLPWQERVRERGVLIVFFLSG